MVSSEHFRHELAKKIITLILAVAGLLIIRAIVDNLPMITHASPILLHRQKILSENALQLSPQDMTIMKSIIQNFDFGTKLAAAKFAAEMKAERRTIMNHPSIWAKAGIIFPVSIANAIIDTLIFFAALTIVQGIRSLMLFSLKQFPESGTLIFLCTLLIVVVWAYSAYEPVVLPLLGKSSDLYGWIFLLFGIAPLVGIVVISYRNIDAITGLVFTSARTTLAQRCPRCRKPVESNADFCGECGLQLKVAAHSMTWENKKCSKCSTENGPDTKYCRNCGNPL